MQLIYLGYTAVFQLKPDSDRLFVMDWKTVPKGESWPPQYEDLVEDAGFSPGLSESKDTFQSGYVTGNSDLEAAECVNRIHTRMVNTPAKLDYEISSYGGYSFWLNNKLVITHPAPGRAVLGWGARVTLELEEGSHVFSIRTCPHEGRNGFYFLQRGRIAD
jgi:hypothetical protein